MTVIHPMSLLQLADCAALEETCFTVPWSRKALKEELSNPLAHFLCASVDRHFAGYAVFLCCSGEAELLRIAVAPEYRRRGLGDSLLEAVQNSAEGLEAETLFLEVRETNLPAIALYKKHGFVQIGRRPGYYTAPVEAALLFEFKRTRDEKCESYQ